MKLRIVCLLVMPVLVLVSSVVSSDAKIKFTPTFVFEEEYTDNLFLEHENEDEDWITRVEPGGAIKIDSRLVDLSFDYSLRFTHYMNNDDLTDFDFEGDQRANLGTTFFAERPFTLTVKGSIRRETLDESENSSETNDLINKSTVYDLFVKPQYRLRLGGDSALVLSYAYEREDHEDPRGDDSQGHTGRVSLVKELSTNTEISANYTYKKNISDDEDDYDKQSYTIGLKQQLGPRTKIGLEGGVSAVEYENIDDDQEGVTWSADVSYELSPAITLTLKLSQDFENSSTDGLTETRDSSFTVAYVKDSFRSSFEIYEEQSEYVRIAREDQSYGARFSLAFPLYANLDAGFDAEYENSEYDEIIDRDIDKYSISPSVDYEFSRFVASLSYRYTLNDSNINIDDYTENTLMLRIRLRF